MLLLAIIPEMLIPFILLASLSVLVVAYVMREYFTLKTETRLTNASIAKSADNIREFDDRIEQLNAELEQLTHS